MSQLPSPSASLSLAATRFPASRTVRLAEVISALTFALDLTEGQRPGHTLRSALIAMRLGTEVGLDGPQLEALYYAALLKDSGCSSNAARMVAVFGSPDHDLKRNMRNVDWHDRWRLAMRTARNCGIGLNPLARLQHFLLVARTPDFTREIITVRCERGAQIARVLEFPTATSDAIRHVDEHWCGLGHPMGLAGQAIPILSRILLLSQSVEAYFSEHGIRAALDMARRRRGTWFDPALVDRLVSWRRDHSWWATMAAGHDLPARVVALEPGQTPMLATDERLDRIAHAFAAVIDAKSPFTARHSTNVARYAVAIGSALGGDAESARVLLRAGLLHDIGKLGVSNRILDKPGPLTAGEFGEIRRHPRFTLQILERVSAFGGFAREAAQHHERLDGRGYPWNVPAAGLSMTARVLAAADVYEALTADRPYRSGLPVPEVADRMRRDRGTAFDPLVLDCTVALAEQGTFAHLAESVEAGFEALAVPGPRGSLDRVA